MWSPKEIEAIQEAIRFLNEAAGAMDQADSCLRSAGLNRDVTTLRVGSGETYLTANRVYHLIKQLVTDTTMQLEVTQ